MMNTDKDTVLLLLKDLYDGMGPCDDCYDCDERDYSECCGPKHDRLRERVGAMIRRLRGGDELLDFFCELVAGRAVFAAELRREIEEVQQEAGRKMAVVDDNEKLLGELSNAVRMEVGAANGDEKRIARLREYIIRMNLTNHHLFTAVKEAYKRADELHNTLAILDGDTPKGDPT